MPTKLMKNEKQEALDALRLQIKPGDTLLTTVRHVSRSGMYRVIDVYMIKENELLRYSWSVAKALEYRYDKNHEGVGVSGCGMNMCYSIIHNLGYALFPNGFTCIGDKCPSNDHSNGDLNYSPHHHKSSGYVLKNKTF